MGGRRRKQKCDYRKTQGVIANWNAQPRTRDNRVSKKTHDVLNRFGASIGCIEKHSTISDKTWCASIYTKEGIREMICEHREIAPLKLALDAMGYGYRMI